MTSKMFRALGTMLCVIALFSGGCLGLQEPAPGESGDSSRVNADGADVTSGGATAGDQTQANESTCDGNAAPAADAGSSRTATVGDTLVLDGSASADPDGDALTFEWSQAGGPSVALNDANQAIAVLVPEEAGIYTFQIDVDDGCAADEATVTIEVVEPPPADAIIITTAWTGGTRAVYGAIAWTLPGGDQISRTAYYNEEESGVSAITEERERALDGVHEIAFRLTPDGAALADVTFRVQFLDYEFEVSRARFAAGDRHALAIEVKDGCVTELANSWRMQSGQSPPSTDACGGERNIRLISEWADATSNVYGEIRWTLPSGDELSRTAYYNEVVNGVSALSEVPKRAVDGVHLINFRIAGNSLALVDTRFRVEFLNYVFETTRERIAGTTAHTIALEVRDGCVTELANSWRLVGGDLADEGAACSPPSGVRIASVWADADAPVYGNLIWTLPDGSQIRRTAYYNEVIHGVSALSEVPEQVTDGIHEIRFRLAGNGVTLADVEFRLEFLGYEFEAARNRMAGETEHTIQLDVRDGRGVEIGNTW